MTFPFLQLPRRAAGTAVVLAGMLASPAAAQTTTLTTQAVNGFTPSGQLRYQGPRYPGGPDSLRAFVARQLRDANPAWVGDVFVQLTLDSLGGVQKADYLVPPPGTPAATLVRNQEVQALVTRAVRRLPRWQPAPRLPAGQTVQPVATVLRLPFGSPAPVALPYADEEPVLVVAPRQRSGPPPRFPTIRTLLQLAFRYPAADLRAQRQGTAYGYFEVSETGAVENRRVVGSLSATLDAELLRVLALLPAATVPPRQQGRPVRVGYVVPVLLKLETIEVGR